MQRPKIAKEYAFPELLDRLKTKHVSTTKCINHWADSANIKRITLNQLCSGLTGKYFEIGNKNIPPNR